MHQGKRNNTVLHVQFGPNVRIRFLVTFSYKYSQMSLRNNLLSIVIRIVDSYLDDAREENASKWHFTVLQKVLRLDLNAWRFIVCNMFIYTFVIVTI